MTAIDTLNQLDKWLKENGYTEKVEFSEPITKAQI